MTSISSSQSAYTSSAMNTASSAQTVSTDSSDVVSTSESASSTAQSAGTYYSDGYQASGSQNASYSLLGASTASAAGPQYLSAEELSALKTQGNETWSALDPEARKEALAVNNLPPGTDINKLTVDEFRAVVAHGEKVQAERNENGADNAHIVETPLEAYEASKQAVIDGFNDEITDLEEERDRMLELADNARDETCGTGQLMSESDSDSEKAGKVVTNFISTATSSSYECAGGDAFANTMEERAEGVQEEIDALTEMRDLVAE